MFRGVIHSARGGDPVVLESIAGENLNGLNGLGDGLFTIFINVSDLPVVLQGQLTDRRVKLRVKAECKSERVFASGIFVKQDGIEPVLKTIT